MEPKKTPLPPLLPSDSDAPLPKNPPPAEPKTKAESKEKSIGLESGETKSFQQLWIARREGASASDSIQLGLYNHSDREILLDVDGKPLKLPSLHYWLVKKPRSFTWREKDGDLHKVSVPMEVDGVELIFKK